jgi:TetR/AcrR family transcriptional repressor of nem operon
MGHAQHQKIKTHERIVPTAAQRLREKGLEGVAIAAANGPWQKQRSVAESGGPALSYENLSDSYLSESHRDHPGNGCLDKGKGGCTAKQFVV